MIYGIGDTITFRDFMGGLVTGIVAVHEDDIKNGRPGFDLADRDGNLIAWGYDDQIVQVNVTMPPVTASV